MILVTGGAGFIGSNLVASLPERQSSPVYICDRVDSDEKRLNLRKHNIAGIIEPESLLEWLDSDGATTEYVSEPAFTYASAMALKGVWRTVRIE